MRKFKIMFCILLSSILLLSSCGNIETKNVQKSTSDSEKNTKDIDENADQTQKKNVEQKDADISLKNGYGDSERTIRVLGLKEYKNIKTKKYKDSAKKGKKYVVLFLEINNKSTQDEYFNVNYLSATVDGEKIENTFLLNSPEGYPTIFTTYNANTIFAGYIVWEVPDHWKKLIVNYNGWKDSDGLSLHLQLKPSNLKSPEKYDSVMYGK